jgi:hypothetical protein
MTVKSKAFGAAVVLVGAGTIATLANDPDVFKGFVNPAIKSTANYDDGPERITVRLTWGKGQLADGLITVNSSNYLNRTLDSINESHAPTWTLRLKKGDNVYARIVPRAPHSGSSCSITDPKHPELIKMPAVVGIYQGTAECHLTVLG